METVDTSLNMSSYYYPDMDPFFTTVDEPRGFFATIARWLSWEYRMQMRSPTPKDFAYPSFIYLLSIACIATALNVKERYRAALVTASVAIGIEICRYLSGLEFVYAAKDTLIKIVIIHNTGAIIMILWEKFCLTEEQKSLSWKKRAIATYKIMWNSRFVNTARPAPVYHLQKAAEESKRAAALAAVAVETAKNTMDNDKNGIDNDKLENSKVLNNASEFAKIIKTWHNMRQLSSRSWNSIKPRWRFVIRTFGIIVAIWYLELLKDHLWHNYVWFNWSDVIPEKRIYFRRLLRNEVDLRETGIRAYFAFEGVWGAYSWYTRWHYTCALFFVAIGIDEPEEWPPTFGDIRQAWNLRRFWSKYFDRLIYRSVNGLGEIFMAVIGMGPRPYRGKKRWLLNGLVFAISGFFHAATDVLAGIHCGFWWELWWWLAQFVAVASESAFLYSVMTYFPRFYNMMSGKTGKAIGFFWVFMWLFYSIPKNQYVSIWCMP
ncbi:hypothetical protein EsH8_II_001465 [Colletotrichum jinshuiense]